MNFKTTILLLVLLVMVGAASLYIFKNQPGGGPGGETPPAPGMGTANALFAPNALSASAVSAITIAWQGKTAVLTRQGGGWMQTQPIRYPLERSSIDNMIETAGNLRFSRSVEPGSGGTPSLADMKLAEPEVTITFEMEGPGQIRHVLRLGRIVPGAPLGYLARDDDKRIYLVEDGLHRMLMPALGSPETAIRDWRSKTLPTPAAGQVEQVVLTREGTAMVLDRRGEQWSLTAPQTGRADAQTVQALLAAVTNLRVDHFVDDQAADLSPYGLAKPTTVVQLRMASAATTSPATPSGAVPVVKTLRIGSAVDRYYATWSDGPTDSRVVFEVQKYEVEAFNKNLDDLRDPRITTLAAGDVRQVEVTHGGQVAFHLVRDAGDGPWHFADPKPPFTADSATVNQLLTTLAETRSHTFEPGAKPKSAESATVTLTAVGAPAPEVLHLYATDGPDGQTLVIRNTETTGYRVDPQRVSALSGSARAVRDRQVWDLQADQVKTLRIVQPEPGGGQVTLAFERPFTVLPPASQPASLAATTLPASTQPAAPPAAAPMLVPGAWKPQRGSEPFESLAVESLVAQLGGLRAVRWLAPGPPQPAAAATRIEIGTVGGQSLVLTIDVPTRRALFHGDQPFEVSAALADDAAAEFRFRTVLPAASNDIRKITVTAAAGTISIERDDAGRYVSADGRKIDQAAAGGMFDTLGGLRVERFVTPAPGSATATTGGAGAGPQFHVVTRDGKMYDLQLASADPDAPTARLAHLGSQWFKLDRATIDKLRADLIAKEEP